MKLVDTKLEPPHLQRNSEEFQIIKDIASGDDDGPVLMINMNGYYKEAGYPDGVLRLPTSSVCSDGNAEGDVVKTGHAAPDNHVAGRWIMLAGKVAAKHGDLQ